MIKFKDVLLESEDNQINKEWAEKIQKSIEKVFNDNKRYISAFYRKMLGDIIIIEFAMAKEGYSSGIRMNDPFYCKILIQENPKGGEMSIGIAPSAYKFKEFGYKHLRSKKGSMVQLEKALVKWFTDLKKVMQTANDSFQWMYY